MDDITVVRYSSGLKEEWDLFVKKSKNPLFMFERDYMDYHSDRFNDHSLIFKSEGEIIAVMPANEKENILYSHGGLTFGGLIVDDLIKQHTVNRCFVELIIYLKKQGITTLYYKHIPHMYHLQPSEEDIYAIHQIGGKLFEVAAATVINLRKPLKMPKGRKAQIKRAIRENVEISLSNEKSDYVRFIALENEVLEQRHSTHAVHTADELFMLHENFPDQIKLYVAKSENEIIAGTVIFEYDDVVHTQYMAADEVARRIGALDLVINTVIEEYKKNKRWLDFGISTEDGGRYLNEGLISQKESFGGRTNIYALWKIEITEGKVDGKD